MKSSIVASLLFSVALAQDAQIPLKEKAAGWFDKAKSYIPSVTPSIPNPIDAGDSAVADKKVQKINIRNYQRLLQPKIDGEEEWLIYVTGGNKSCFGRCGKADAAWSQSVPLLAALPQSAGSSELKLGQVDCEKEPVLCSAWAASCPSIFHFTVPQLNSLDPTYKPTSPLRVKDLNVTSTTADEIVRLASRAPGSYIMDVPEYSGVLHPVDGMLAKFGVQEYLGYFIWALGSTPSWLIMIVISFASRQFMGRRMAGNAGRPAPNTYGTSSPAGAAPAGGPAPAAAKPGTPGSAGKGGKKRR